MNTIKNFDEFVSLWKEQTLGISIKEKELLFLVVYLDKLEWDFSIEKQTQTTTLMVSGGVTGAGTGHDVQFCYRNEVHDFLLNCTHRFAMIVSVGMVFDMVSSNTNTPISDFYKFTDSGEYCKAHIIARLDEPAFLHHQHMNLNVDMWKTIGAPRLDVKWIDYKRSDNNYHDDYTPFWIKIKDHPIILNFTMEERRRKSFSYYRDYNDAWKNLSKIWNYVDKDDFYFTRYMTRMNESFYVVNTESFKELPDVKFDILFSPTAGYSAETCVDKLDFDGEVIFYDYVIENLNIKKQIINMNMSMFEIISYARLNSWPIVFNDDIRHKERLTSYGTLEEQRKMQEKMINNCEIDYWLMDLINPDYNKLSEKVKDKIVLFDASNIFSYHMSHGNYTLNELVNSYAKLHESLGLSKQCWIQGTKPTKQWVRKWI